LNKGELIAAVARETGESKALTERMLNRTLDVIMDGVVSGVKVRITDFGSFEARERAARTARNPKTGDTVQVEATTVPVFKAGKAFKEAVREAGA
jgi:DNA-binding protein HU-beta